MKRLSVGIITKNGGEYLSAFSGVLVNHLPKQGAVLYTFERDRAIIAHAKERNIQTVIIRPLNSGYDYDLLVGSCNYIIQLGEADNKFERSCRSKALNQGVDFRTVCTEYGLRNVVKEMGEWQ